MKHEKTGPQRLDRYLSHATGLSRREAQRVIRAGEVRVGADVVRDPGALVSPGMAVVWAGESLATPTHRYFMVHKPAGVVCATRDAQHPTVLELIDVPNPADLHLGRSRHPASRGTRASLHIVGRLDLDATGLVLVTDDGAWSHRVMSPRHKVPKTYRVTLAEPLTEKAIAALQKGVELKEEKRRTLPAQVEPVTDTVVRLTITEGKYHQVKRMMAAVKNHVVALHRERIGAVVLDATLTEGEVRPLTKSEVEAFVSSR
jgi:16S rRNA pseudouridine516 synthase